ncbi:hypothetical protein HNV11_15175 [Spirosoma taeanense]|uniref:Uncharacterized protein n=1 Tax=Spirosoma taeanense TaxID=2735870 RepID=A0A6M5Y9I9_9BACT|nr:hypothetical protein [Spirosoma taeanense]QJW90629.1 hypothetical protein HNV11_15175 [Spirosoma taeanense]
MLLFFTALDRTTQFLDFSCHFDRLEDACDLLSSIVSSGDTLIKVGIIENNSCTDLPSQVFDGERFSTAMQQLEQEWQSILTRPHRSSQNNEQELINLTRQRIVQFDSKIQIYTRTIQAFDRLIQRAEEHFLASPRKYKFVNYYERMISRYQRFVVEAQEGKDAAIARLIQLECVNK